MTTSPDATGRVREHFRRKAFSFDHLYDEEHALQRLLRPGLFNRRELAIAVAAEHEAPSVLDVGGGSGRIGEPILEQGASRYVDVDLSDTMLELARERLARFGERAERGHVVAGADGLRERLGLEVLRPVLVRGALLERAQRRRDRAPNGVDGQAPQRDRVTERRDRVPAEWRRDVGAPAVG